MNSMAESGTIPDDNTMRQRVNTNIAARLEEVADLLATQHANPYRVEAYRHAAVLLRQLDCPVSDIVSAQGIEGLKALPGIGESLARSIHQMVTTGRLPMLERLRGESDPVEMLESVPGIGRVFAQQLYYELGIETLEELEAAAYDGRLAELAGMGTKRIAGIRDSLASRLGRIKDRFGTGGLAQPAVAEILDVDREYRTRAAQGELQMIAPRRFNPAHEAWLPVLHTVRGARHYTALFSNTAHAHQVGKTHDWVVIYYDGGSSERQCTVITAERGTMKSRRIVRGREAECSVWYFKPRMDVSSERSAGL